MLKSSAHLPATCIAMASDMEDCDIVLHACDERFRCG